MLSFLKCQQAIESQLKRGFDKKKLGHNTYLRKLTQNRYAITLHQTDIIVISERNGETIYCLNSGGYRTVTTKDRLNSLSPARIYQKRGVWYLSENNDTKNDIPYFDFVEVDARGMVVNKDSVPADLIEKRKLLDRLINEYIRGFAKDAVENGLRKPETGDCLMCRLYLDNQDKDDMGHVCCHLYEKYYTRIFLYYCLKMHGYSNPGFTWALIAKHCENGRDEMLKRELRYGFARIKERLLNVFDISEYKAAQERLREPELVD
jgi:hypothetical protein